MKPFICRAIRQAVPTALFVACLATGCVKATHSNPVGSSDAVPQEETEPPPPERPEKIPDDIVLRSRLSFEVVKADGNVPLSTQEFFDDLAARDLICLGEQHDNPHHHWVQLYAVQELAQRAVISGRELGLGLEMFQTPFQSVLDDYARDKIGQRALLRASEYEDRWGFPFAFYRHQMDHMLARGGALVALNADRELTRQVAREGLESLDEKDLRGVGSLELNDPEHRKRFDELMKGHPDTGMSRDNMYAAQVLWDETMASTAAEWLRARFPARQLVVLAGTAHCHQSGIPSRVERRAQVDAVGVLPLAADADPTAELKGYDYGLLMGK